MKRNNYPKAAGRNQLLSNSGKGKFEDVIKKSAPGLIESGMVTGAIWTDADNDGWIDLFLTHEWGTPQLWMNRKGVLVNETDRAGLSKLVGRWNGVTGRDIDNDGDIDYLLSNIGTNSDETVSAVFSKKFPESKWPAVVFAHREDSKWLPTGNWSQWAGIPTVKKMAPSPADFVKKADSLFGLSKPAVSITQRRSGVLINFGSGKFVFRPLPPEAQIAPVYGIVLSDFNFDGKCDAFVLHNSTPPSIRNPDPGNNGVSRLFLGTGDAAAPFRALTPDVSGLVLFGVGRAAVVSDLNADGRADLVCSMNGSESGGFSQLRAIGTISAIEGATGFHGETDSRERASP